MSAAKNTIEIYTDGAARGNPGPAGWASIVMDHNTGTVRELGGREDTATNNRMELMAVYQSLAYVEKEKLFDVPVTFFTDSAYVQKGVTLWMYAWEKNGWKTKDGGDVFNRDIWQELIFLVFRLKRKMTISFEKIAGHAGHFGNEQADRVATSFADKKPTPLFKGALEQYLKFYQASTPAAKKESGSGGAKKTGKAYSYVSLVAGKVYTDKDWATCEARVKGKRGVKYKKVFSKMEENALVHEYQKS
jgi:ribonuclease HI